MKINFSNKYVVAVISFMLGGLVFWGANSFWFKRQSNQRENGEVITENGIHQNRFLDNFFNKNFFDKSRDPFEEMRRMRKEMNDLFRKEDNFGDSFNHWYQDKFGGGDLTDLKQREDEQYVYYDISIQGNKPDELKIDVKDEMISISGKFEKQKSTDESDSFVSSNFQRTFPIPRGVDYKSFTTEKEEDKIILRFSKIK